MTAPKAISMQIRKFCRSETPGHASFLISTIYIRPPSANPLFTSPLSTSVSLITFHIAPLLTSSLLTQALLELKNREFCSGMLKWDGWMRRSEGIVILSYPFPLPLQARRAYFEVMMHRNTEYHCRPPVSTILWRSTPSSAWRPHVTMLRE